MACIASPVPLSFPLHWPHLTSFAEQAGYKWRHMNMSAMHDENKDDGGLNFRQERLVVQLGFSDVIFLNTLLNDFYTTEYKYMDIDEHLNLKGD